MKGLVGSMFLSVP